MGIKLNLATLLTESRNPATEHIDQLPTLDMLRLLNDEDAKVASAVAAVLTDIARHPNDEPTQLPPPPPPVSPDTPSHAEDITALNKDGGRLFYIGAGTS